MTNKEIWEKLHKEPRFRPKYPSESVVQYAFRNFKRDGNTKVLDLGCGAGRHIFFMAKENIIPYGIDISEEGVRYTRELLKRYKFDNFAKNIIVGDFTNLKFENNYFDGIICYGVLYYSKKEQIEKSVEEIYRVLKEDGKALIVVRNTKDYRFGLGKEIEKNTFIIDENDSNKCAYNESAMIMHFFTEEEIRSLFYEFSKVEIDILSETHENNSYKDSNYIIRLSK